MKNLRFGTNVLLVAILILNIAVIPAMSAESKEITDQKKEEKTHMKFFE